MKIVLFILFVFSTTNLLGYISNGGDIIFAILLHRIKNIDSPKEYLGKEINLLQLQESLSKFDVPSKISTSGINSLKDNVWIVFELKPVLSNSEPELGLIECSDSGKFYIYDIFMYKRHLIDINAVNELFKYTTGRYLRVGKCIASNKVVIRHFPDITHKKKKNIVCNTGSFIDYSIGEHIKIPKSVDLGLVASGGLKIPVKIPIESIDNVKADIISIQVPCGCISEIKKPNKISTNSKSNIEFMRHRLVFGKVVYKLRLLVYKGTERLVFLPVVTLLKPVTVCVYIRAAGLYNKLKTVRRYFEIPGHTVNNISLLGLGFKIEISGQHLKQLYISSVSRNNNALPYIRYRNQRLRAVRVPAAVYGDRFLFSRYQFLDIHFVPL